MKKIIVITLIFIALLLSYFVVKDFTYKNSYQYKLKELNSCLQIVKVYEENNPTTSSANLIISGNYTEEKAAETQSNRETVEKMKENCIEKYK